jgi:hypothetical protein
MIPLSPLSSLIVMPHQIFAYMAMHDTSYDIPIVTSLTVSKGNIGSWELKHKILVT